MDWTKGQQIKIFAVFEELFHSLLDSLIIFLIMLLMRFYLHLSVLEA